MKKLLIAEDNDLNFMLFIEIFNNANLEIIRAKNGLEAVECCDKNPDISLILMDINMPVMNGEEAAVLIKQKHDIPIISQTAYGVYGTVSDENKHYFVEFISKPINVKEMRNIIEKYCFNN